MLHHFSRNNVIISVLWWSFEKFRFWHICGQSKSSKRIHNQVDPKELNGVKWGLTGSQRSNQYCKQSININCQLELEETLNVIKYISSPLASFDDGSEAVILK